MDPLLCAELAALDSSSPDTESAAPIRLERSAFATFSLYVRLGIEHILPDGKDHLLFILALLLSSTQFKRLLLQISVFTLAHSITLFLAALSLVSYSSALIEVLIAISIAAVGIENIVMRRVHWWRIWIIFIFGLLHGLGFAGALSDIGLERDTLLWSLLGFNVGVEVAQLLFASVLFVALYRFMSADWYRKFLVIPVSIGIAIVAMFWVVERIA